VLKLSFVGVNFMSSLVKNTKYRKVIAKYFLTSTLCIFILLVSLIYILESLLKIKEVCGSWQKWYE